MLDLISEGPIFGPPSGDPAQSVYLNGVPLKNADGTYNFAVDSFDFRYGEVDQTYIRGFDSAQHEVAVNVPLTHAVPWSVVVTDLSQNAIVVTLGVSALSETDSGNGNVNGYNVAYQIQMQVDSGAWQAVVDTAFSGKCSSAYQRSHRIPLNGATSQYSLRVVRTTADSTSVYIQDKTSVVSYTLIVDAKLRYPYSALAALSIDAVQFSSVPTRSYDLKGLLVSVPSNYDPVRRVYYGAWDGTFVKAWTDNPAWIFYDLVLNTRYGLGEVVDASMVDRYSLYQTAQYCDQLVSDGKGGQEPRFTCNCYIQSRADAYKVLQDLASVFRGMAYWGAGAVVATCDMPTDPAYLYTAANVVGGEFKYTGAALKSRYTCAVVTWNDPDNAFKQAVEYVEDAEGIARYGINRAQVTAFGCTSRGQAQRVGQWMIITSRYETNVITFSVGLDGTLCQPGQIVAIADPARANARRGGRISSAADTSHVTLDRIDGAMAVGDSFNHVRHAGGEDSRSPRRAGGPRGADRRWLRAVRTHAGAGSADSGATGGERPGARRHYGGPPVGSGDGGCPGREGSSPGNGPGSRDGRCFGSGIGGRCCARRGCPGGARKLLACDLRGWTMRMVAAALALALAACAASPGRTVVQVQTPPDSLLQDCKHAPRPTDPTVNGLMLGLVSERGVLESCDWADKAALRAWKAGVVAGQAASATQ